MNKKMTYVAFGAAFIGLGIAMPQCPQEKVMQQQIDNLQATHVGINQKISMLEGQNRTLNTQMEQVKQVLTQMAAAVNAQKDALTRMDTAVKELQAKVAASTSRKTRKSVPHRKKK